MILEVNKFDINEVKNIEGQMTIGNGKINIRGSFEEGLEAAPQNLEYMRYPTNVTIETKREPISKFGVYCPLITGNHPLLNNVIINLPYLIGLKIKYGNEYFDMEQSIYSDLSIQLDTATAEYARKFKWFPKSGGVIEVCLKRFASFADQQLIGQQIKVKQIEGDQLITIYHHIDSNITTNGYNHFKQLNHSIENKCLVCSGLTDNDDQFVIKSHITSHTHVESEELDIDKKYIAHSFAGEYLADRISDIQTRQFEAPNWRYNQLFKQHLSRYTKEYDFAQIKIEGNNQLQEICDFSTYHLLRAQNFKSSDYAICAKGFAGEAYFGHYFWDTEIYMLPFFLYTAPERAKQLLKFRVNTLEGAIQNAKTYGYKGAKYPWEASSDGSEQCPNWQYSDFEIHVSADIVYGINKYYDNTGDLEFMKQGGYQLISQVATYFADRIYFDGQGFHLNGVMGPDEYMFFTNDNYYTNYMVNETFKTYQKFSRILALVEDKQIIKLIDQLPFLQQGNILMQCAQFEKYEQIDVNKVWEDRSSFFASNISQEQNYRSRFLKQADVVNLFHLFDSEFTTDVITDTLNYYQPITSHDSSLSKIIHAIVDCKINQPSIEKIIDAGGLDLYGKGASEGIHIANAGGVWQSIFFGLLGARNNIDELSFAEVKMADGLQQITMNVRYKNQSYKLIKNQSKVEVTLIENE